MSLKITAYALRSVQYCTILMSKKLCIFEVLQYYNNRIGKVFLVRKLRTYILYYNNYYNGSNSKADLTRAMCTYIH